MQAKRLRNRGTKLDVIDIKLLQALGRDGRTTTAELARLVEMSAPSVSERLRRLEDAGVISGYRIEVDPAALGSPLGVVIRVRPNPGELQRVAAAIHESPEVVECHRITGDDCFIAIAYVAGIDHLERLIDRLVPMAQTHTSVVQSSPVRRRLPALSVT
ncbi:MAG: Lrp/AsnC family transcriptional regulator [Methylobacteriaceae bacterium]|nr:Lrp/AsnC family transcriptional regulator [Methylobacteriaceae bacterium]MBV9220404.1 Lrp/AsnC family transcriptional regulator [Methylobacteriaceae bacterium]MBV9634063.1 Lrp/AsnC family transcriptional regulator [Methylobacteriaceae bacterium]MBV9705435.1 Lrp/AsnC family transcriptional regulator [Methylobacteriaceae bacterium]